MGVPPVVRRSECPFRSLASVGASFILSRFTCTHRCARVLRRRQVISLSVSVHRGAHLLLQVVVVVVSVVYYKVTSTLDYLQLYTQPHVYEAVNRTMSLLRHADRAATGANRVVEDVHSLTDATVPALQSALQQSASIVDRLERLARNPTIQLRLGEGQT